MRPKPFLVSEMTLRRFAERGYMDVKTMIGTNVTVNDRPYGPVLKLRAEGHGLPPVVSLIKVDGGYVRAIEGATVAEAYEIAAGLCEKAEEISRKALEHIDTMRSAA